MIFRPQPSAFTTWPVECVPVGTTVITSHNIKAEVVDHDDTSTDQEPEKWTVWLRKPDGSLFSLEGFKHVIIAKAPPTWYP